jgi:hypothetical protein
MNLKGIIDAIFSRQGSLNDAQELQPALEQFGPTLSEVLGKPHHFKAFYGNGAYHTAVTDMIKSGYTPVSLIEVIRMRILGLNKNPALLNVLNIPFMTPDMIAMYDGQIKIVPGPECLVGLIRSSKYNIKRGDYIICKEQYDAIGVEAMEFSNSHFCFQPGEGLGMYIWAQLTGDQLPAYKQGLIKYKIATKLEIWVKANWAAYEHSHDVILSPIMIESMTNGSDLNCNFSVSENQQIYRKHIIGKREIEIPK